MSDADYWVVREKIYIFLLLRLNLYISSNTKYQIKNYRDKAQNKSCQINIHAEPKIVGISRGKVHTDYICDC